MTVSSLLKTVCGFWKLRIISLVLLLSLIPIGIFYMLYPEYEEVTFSPVCRSDNHDAEAGEIVNGDLLRQPICMRKYPLKAISVKFATYMRKNHGKIRLYLKDDTTGEVLYDTRLEMGDLEDNQYHRIAFPEPIKADRKHKIALYLEGTPECRTGNAVTCWTRGFNHPVYQKNGVDKKFVIMYKSEFDDPNEGRAAIVGELANGVLLRQPIVASRHPICAVSVNFATFARKNRGKIRFYLKDDTAGKVLYDTKLEMGDLKDNQYHRIAFPKPIKVDRKHQIAFYLEGTPDCRPGNAVTCWALDVDQPGYHKNGNEEDRTIRYEISRSSKPKRSSYVFLVFIFAFAAAVLLLFPVPPRRLAGAFFGFCKTRVFALILLAFAIVLAAVHHLSPPTHRLIGPAFVDSTHFKRTPSPPLLADTEICQTLSMKEPVSQLFIRFATYRRVNRGVLKFELKDETADRVLYSTVIKMDDLKDNQFKCIRFPRPISLPSGHQAVFRLRGTPGCTPENSVSCWMYSSRGNDDNIMFKMGVLRKAVPFYLVVPFLFAAIVMAILKDTFILNMVDHPEKVFLIVGTVSALAITAISLPFSIVDSPAHLKRLYQISEGKLFYRPKQVEVSPLEEKWSEALSARDCFTMEKFRITSAARGVVLESVPFDCGPVNQKHYIMGYTPFAYLHSATAAWIARKLRLSLYDGIGLISAACILFYLLGIYMSIRWLPRFQWPLLLVALMPGALWYGMSFSADSFVMVVTFLFFSWCMKLCETDRRYTLGELSVLAILALLLSQCKFIYFPVLTVMFLLPVGNFKSRRRYWAFILSVIFASVFLGWLWNKLATDPATMVNLDGRTTPEKMRLILTRPWHFAAELWDSVSRTWHLSLRVGIQRCSFNEAPNYDNFWIIYSVVFISYFFISRERPMKFPRRIFYLTMFFFSVVMIYAAIFCINNIKNGIQGRYLIPLLPLLFLALGQKKFGLPEKYLPYYKGFLILFLAAVQFFAADALRQSLWL